MISFNVLRSERFRRLSKEGSWIVLGQILTVLGSLAGVRILTEFLDSGAYGELALGMTSATLVNQVVLGPLSNGVTRFFSPAKEQGDLSGYLKAVRQWLLYATGLIIIVILFTIFGLLIVGRTEWITLATAALIFAILSGCNSILSGIQNAARQRSVVALHRGLESWGRFLVAAGFMVLLGATSEAAMIGYAVAVILVLGSQYIFFRKIIPKNAYEGNNEKDWSKQIGQFSWPFAAWGLFTWVRLASDRWALGVFSTTQEVGFYAVLFQLGYYPILMATGVATQFFAPIFYQRAGDASDGVRNADVNKLSWRLTNLALGVTGVVFLGAFKFHPLIFDFFAAKEYASVSYLLPWMLLSGGIFAAGQTIGLNLMSQMKTQAMMSATIITALLGVMLNLAGAYWYGTAGIVGAGILFSFMYFLWMLVLSLRVCRPLSCSTV